MNDWNISDIAPGKQMERWSDEAMFTAQKASSLEPRVTLLDGPSDPLGKLAYIAKAYQGKFPRSYEDISDEDREYYVFDMEKNILGMPSEAVMYHFMIENVTRSFTHQLVRTRHASFAQESLRFAVKEDFPTSLPPHLIGTKSLHQRVEEFGKLMGWSWNSSDDINAHYEGALKTCRDSASEKEHLRDMWDDHMEESSKTYLELINSGMPAEDARGMVPHSILTNINMAIDLRALMNMAGQRLCTQAQWEHKTVWDGIIDELSTFGDRLTYRTKELPKAGVPYSEQGDHHGNLAYEASSAWQYRLLADRFKPICYQTGSCQFRSDFDRYCNIRDRVQKNAAIGRDSKEWDKPHMITTKQKDAFTDKPIIMLGIPAIGKHEWLRPDAAIKPTGDWRSTEAKKNIEGRR